MNVSLYARPVMDHQVENTKPGIALVAHDACKQEMIEGSLQSQHAFRVYALYDWYHRSDDCART